MRNVIHGKRGTARGAALGIDGIEMAGKTGTSQVKRISKADRASGAHKRKGRPWKERDHALFVCFAPYAAPRYAISVIVEHGEGGSTAAAPIARDIMRRCLELAPSTDDLRASLPPVVEG
jgi:penicillin-binding protein 2